jgi:hypothetical protein
MWMVMVVSMAHAGAPDTLDAGELYGSRGGWSGTAHTVPKGMVALHPLNRSAVGVTDFLDVKFGILGQILGPELGLEVQLLGRERDDVALSVETYNATGWRFNSLTSINHLHLTVPASDATLVTLSMMGGTGPVGLVAQGTAEIEQSWLAQPEVSVDVKLSDTVNFTGTGRTAIHGWAADVPNATVGGIFSFGSEVFGCSGGLNLVYGGIQTPLPVSSGELDFNSDLAVIPWPHAQMWFRI